MRATDRDEPSGFYSARARAQGGRQAALNALDELMDDLEVLIVDCDQKILALDNRD